MKPSSGLDFNKKKDNNIEGKAAKTDKDPDSFNYDYSQDNTLLYNKDINSNNYRQYQNQFQTQFNEDDSVSKDIGGGDGTHSKDKTNSMLSLGTTLFSHAKYSHMIFRLKSWKLSMI